MLNPLGVPCRPNEVQDAALSSRLCEPLPGTKKRYDLDHTWGMDHSISCAYSAHLVREGRKSCEQFQPEKRKPRQRCPVSENLA